jgi:HAE1 family hydrophobic/amphiphilic exporter-1/multidrug efflux pump
VLIGLCLGTIWLILRNMQSEIAPLEDRNSVRFTVTLPEGASYSYTSAVTDQIANYLYDSVPERDFVFARTPAGSSVNTSQPRIGLVPADQRQRSQNQIAADLQRKLSKFNDARIFAIQEQTIAVGSGSKSSLPVQFVLENQDLDKMKKILPAFLDAARKDHTFSNVDVNLKFNKPEVQISVDRMKIRDLGLSTNDVIGAMQSAFSGGRLAYFIMNGYQYYVIAQVERKDRNDPADISKVYVRNNRGEPIPLAAVVHVEQNSGPSTLYHFNRYKAATVSASLAEGKTIGDGIAAMQAIAHRLLDQDPSFQTALSGSSRDYAESSSNILFALVLALLLIYLVLAAQFESFIDPLTIIMTVPLAFAGALLSLWLFHQTLNIFSEIGMIMLIGLVTKNGILIVEFTNQKRELGMSKMEAVVEAASQRLRPILMTSLATSLGALPIALSLGAAATSRIPLGIVVVGGILFSLILTLFVIPAVYTFISSKHKVHVTEVTE